MPEQHVDEKTITEYLLGALPEAETERLDELSLVDDELAERLRAAENDLVDSYVRGELSGNMLASFKSHYLASSRRREKVAFAEAFVKTVDQPVIDPAKQGTIETQSSRSRWHIFFAVPGLALERGLAAIALILLLAGGYLLFENARLRNQVEQAQAEHATLERREKELRKQLALQNSSNAEKEDELRHVHDRLTRLEHQLGAGDQRDVKVFAFNLPPQNRGMDQIPLLTIPSGTEFVAITMELEVNDTSAYQGVLKNPADGKVLWRSGTIKVARESKSIQVKLPANLLKAQNYLLELSGISPDGTAEMISGYPFRVVTK